MLFVVLSNCYDVIGFCFVIIIVKLFNLLGLFLFLVDCDLFVYFWGFYFVNVLVFILIRN